MKGLHTRKFHFKFAYRYYTLVSLMEACSKCNQFNSIKV